MGAVSRLVGNFEGWYLSLDPDLGRASGGKLGRYEVLRDDLLPPWLRSVAEAECCRIPASLPRAEGGCGPVGYLGGVIWRVRKPTVFTARSRHARCTALKVSPTPQGSGTRGRRLAGREAHSTTCQSGRVTSPTCGSSSLPFASILDTLGPMLAKVYSCAVIGLDGAIVEVEVDTSNGLPSFVVVGPGTHFHGPVYGKAAQDCGPDQTRLRAGLTRSPTACLDVQAVPGHDAG